MKKVLVLLAFAAAVLAGCNKPNTDDPENGGETEYKAPITVDGDFADWAALDANKVQVFKCAADSPKPDMKLMKVYADKYFVFVYIEFDYAAYDGEVSMAHVDFCIDGDGDTTTGGYSGAWDQGETPSVDVLIEGSVIEDGAVCEAYEPFIGTWSGDVNADGWSWADVEGLTGFVEGKGTKKAWEFRITRELYPAGKMAKEFKMGVLCTVNGWDATGALPNAAVSDANLNGQAPLATINYNK